MADYNELIQSYIAAHPGATEADAQKGLLSLMPGNDSQIANLNLPSANSTPSSYDVQTSDTTVPMKGNQPTVDAPVTPPVQPPEAKPDLSQFTAGMTDYNKLKAPPAPVSKQPEPQAPVSDVSQAINGDNFSADNAKRTQMLAENEKTKKLGALPIALAGAGDAISNTGVAFGGHAAEPQMNNVVKMEKDQEDTRKAAFEDKLKNDPQSDISKSYRAMVLKIAPDLAGNGNFENMSAMAIGDKLPLIDTMMKASAQKDMKEMGMAQLKANKDISLGLKEDQQQDKLEQQYKQQLMSVRGDPNISALEKQRDASAQAYNLIKDSETPQGEYNLSEPQMVELYGQLYTAMTGRGLTAEAQHAMDQSTAKQKGAAIATFIGMSPSATTKAIGDRLKHMTTTLGTQVQGNLDKRMEGRILPPSRLDPKRSEAITKAGRGYTFQELVEQSNKRKADSTTATGAKPTSDPLGLF